MAVADKKAKKKAKKGDGAAAGEAGDADGDDAGKPDGASAKEKDPEVSESRVARCLSGWVCEEGVERWRHGCVG